MIHPVVMHPPAHRDQYFEKGTLEGDTPGQIQQCNCHGTALDESGWPADDISIAEDVFGAEIDDTQG
jgi:hypothetical protein